MVGLFVARIILMGNKVTGHVNPRPNEPMKTMLRWSVIAVLAGLAPLTVAGLRGQPAKPGYSVADLAKIGDDKDVLRDASLRTLTARESGDLALHLAETGHSEAALIVANLGLGAAKDDRERAALFTTLSLTWASRGEYRNAAEAAQKGQELLPDNKTLAGLRFVYFELAGDGLAALAARNHLMRLDPTFARKPVFLAETIVVVEGLYRLYVVTKKVWADIPEPTKERIRAMVREMWSTARASWNS